MNQLDHFPYLSSYVSSMKEVPSGRFRYGQRGWSTQMTSFKIGATPVTWALWKEYCSSTGFQLHDESNQSHLDNHPALVSWSDIMGKDGFTTWASEVSGVLLSLPTSTQFEYAARGGKDGLKYPWGDRFDRRLVWWSADIESAKTTGAVDRLDKIYCNGYGLTDMVGNVPQWCRDRVRTVSTRSIDPVGCVTSPDRDIRGAMVVIPNKYTYFQCAFRECAFIDARWLNIGFRLVAPSNEVQPSNSDATKL